MKGIIKLVLCALVIAGVCATYNYHKDAGKEEVLITMDESVYEEVLRFHVLANSDSEKDQAIKLKVKDYIISKLAKDMSEAKVKTKKQAYRFINDNMDYYIEEAAGVLQARGYDYEVKGELGKCWFPVKIYGDCVYPEGEYDAFRILIGKAEGKNWWCVLFPSLCMVDEAYMVQATQDPATHESAIQNRCLPDKDEAKIGIGIVEWLKKMW